jgi:hypothetical protein
MKKVFLSFAPEDAEKVKSLLPLFCSQECDFDFYDGALDVDVETEDTQAIKRAIGEKIARASVTLCLIGNDTYKSGWVDCKLEKSRQKGNRIIAMALKGIQSVVLPNLIREENLTFYPWDPPKAVKLILA